jgi:hypothetical protein
MYVLSAGDAIEATKLGLSAAKVGMDMLNNIAESTLPAVKKGSAALAKKFGMWEGAGDASIIENNAAQTWYTGSIKTKLANFLYEQEGYSAPYGGKYARDILLKNERLFARVHGENNQVRSWLLRPEDIEGLTPEEIKNKFALPEVPKYISDVYASADTALRLGLVAEQPNWGEKGGGIQYELLSQLPKTAYQSRRLLNEVYNTKPRFNN